MAEIHTNTVRRERGDATRKLTGEAILQCLQIFSVLKHEQGVGETFQIAVASILVLRLEGMVWLSARAVTSHASENNPPI